MVNHTDSTPNANTGLIEGFFGRSWHWPDREAYAGFLKQNGYAFYIYAPKDDPFLRKRWREPWPAETAAALRNLSRIYRATGLKFGIGLSPFEIYRQFDEAARSALFKKVADLDAVGCDLLCLLFDDMRGDIHDLARLQADITHQVARRAGNQQIIMCPTYYSFDPVLETAFGAMPANYFEDIGRLIDPAIHIFWTGPHVCSSCYPEQHLAQVTQLLGRKPFLWDNYPVNDGAKKSRFLHLRAFTNRSFDLARLTAGHAVNPMNQAWLSRIPLMSLSASYQLGPAYDPQEAFQAACRKLCGSELGAAIIADLSYFHDMGLDEIPPALSRELIDKYGRFDSPFAREIVGWLRHENAFDPACLTD